MRGAVISTRPSPLSPGRPYSARTLRTAFAVVMGLTLTAAPAQHEQNDAKPGGVRDPDPRGEPDESGRAVTRPTNRLAGSSSPYLLQHAHNPVDWYPWGDEALRAARDQNKPIFLSIGYAACHWCHVMERECFEDETIAAQMNEWFVNIKVDREERPDLDEIYMAATVGMTGSGGWPMSVFLTPDLEPFFAGTYFPPEDRRGLPGFPRVLSRLHELWTEEPETLRDAGARVAAAIADQLAPTWTPGEAVELASLDLIVEQSRSRFDPDFGGFASGPQRAPKFPHSTELSLLLRAAGYASSSESAAETRSRAIASAREIVTKTLDAMLEGGIHDQLAGGFHRYAVDRRWLVPHFEKMLYDNAQLARLYAEAYAASGEPRYLEVCRSTLDYLVDEMQDEAGGFWSSTDADSEGEEGRFFVWDAAEFDRVLREGGLDDESVQLARARYGVSEGGNWEGTNVLTRSAESGELAKRFELPPEDVRARLASARQTLLAARSRRVAPGLDDKVLTAWNGLALSALAVGHRVTGDERYLAAAQRCADFLLTAMRDPGDASGRRLLRTWRRGRASLSGYLEDHAFVADGLLHLFESDADPRWLRAGCDLLAVVEEHFRDGDDGSFFFTADDHEGLLTRTKNVTESSIPSAIGVAVSAFVRAGLMTGDRHLEELGEAALRAHHQVLSASPIAAPSLAFSADFTLGDPLEVVVVGPLDDPGTRRLLATVRARPNARLVVLQLHEGNRERLTRLAEPIVAGKAMIDGRPAAYVCTRGACRAPVTDAAELDRVLPRSSFRAGASGD
jgi:uncharacterized protein YyaL (SSP411 family)